VGAGSGLSFYPNIFFFGSDFSSTRPEPDPLPSLVKGPFGSSTLPCVEPR
jgi:hypothetical protein